MEKNLNNKQIEGLQRILSLLEPDTLTKEQFASAFESVVKTVKKQEERNIKEFEMIKETFKKFSDKIAGDTSFTLAEMKIEVKRAVDKYVSEMSDRYDIMKEELKQRASEIKDGKDADVDEVVDIVLSKIELPEIKGIEEDLPKMGNPIRDALELLQDDNRLSADAISGLEKMIKKLIKGSTSTQAVGGLRPAGTGIETPSGAINGTNKAYTVNFVPEFITVNGQAIYSGSGYAMSSVSGALTITLENALETGDIIRSHYKEL